MGQQYDASSPRRRWRRLLLIPLFFMVCGAVFVGWAIYHGGQELRDAMAEAAKDDPNWQLADIEANRRQVADIDNSSFVIAAGQRLYVRPANGTQNERWDEVVDELLRFPTAKANEQQTKALLEELKPYAASLTEYRKLKDMTWGRPPLTIAADVVSTLLPFTQHARQAASALRLDAFQKLEANDGNGAVDTIIAGFNAGRSIGDEPFLISALVRIACDSLILNGCERLLAQTTLDDVTLARLQAAIELQMREPVWQTALRGERAFGYAYLQFLKENPGKTQSLRGVLGAGVSTAEDWLVYLPGYAMRGQADLLRHMNEAVAISKRPYEEYLDAFEELDKKSKNLSLLARQVAPTVLKVNQAELRHQTQMRTMLVAVVAERYRLQHNKWPDKLDDLVSAKLITALAMDPFDGKPLRWKVTDEGRIVYSVGKDRIDDGGVVGPDVWTKKNTDIGYRLFDPDKRRQAPRPSKPVEPDFEPQPPG